MKSEFRDMWLLIAFLLLSSFWLWGLVNHYRKRLQNIGEIYTLRDAIKDILSNQIMIVGVSAPLASLNSTSPVISRWLHTLGYFSIAIWFLSWLLFRTPTSEDRFTRHKILKEIKESPEGVSNTLIQSSQSAGSWKWILSSFLLLIGVGLLFIAKDYPLTILLLLLILAVLICFVYLSFNKMEQQDPTQLPPNLR